MSTINHVLDVLCVDLDDTLYLQKTFDNQIIDLAVKSIFLDLCCTENLKKYFSRELKLRRESDRLDGYLFNKVFQEFGFCNNLADKFVSSYASLAVSAYPIIMPCIDAVSYVNDFRSHGITVMVTNGPVKQQLNKISLLGIISLFDEIIVLDGAKPRLTKPDVSILSQFLDSHSIVFGSDSLMIGDSSCDKQFADNLGIRYCHPVTDMGWRLR